MLVGIELTVGKVAIAGCDLDANEAIVGLIPKDGSLIAEYLYRLIPSIDLETYMQPAAKGKTSSKKILRNIRIPVPTPAEQDVLCER